MIPEIKTNLIKIRRELLSPMMNEIMCDEEVYRAYDEYQDCNKMIDDREVTFEQWCIEFFYKED